MTEYEPNRCWYGVNLKIVQGSRLKEQTICGAPAGYYKVTKSLGLAAIHMYLCDKHVKAMEQRKFTVTRA